MTNPIYAIGDSHGYADKLHDVLSWIEADGGPDAQIVFLGDYVDRGPDSRGLLDTLIAGQREGRNWTFLKGNHDRMFEWFMESPPRYDPYLMVELYWMHPVLGGDTTLGSYGVEVRKDRREKDIHADALEAVPPAHVSFLQSLQLSHELETHFFCHAGIRPNVALDQQTEEDLLWIRQEFHNCRRPHPKLIVHGHTPVKTATHYGNRVNLDTGAGYGEDITGAVFEGDRAWILSPKGRVPLTAP